MRKFIVIFSIFLILILANFSLWFVHTRTITHSIEALQKQLVLRGIEFKYKELKFTNFLAWDVRAVVEHASFKHGIEHVYGTEGFKRIDIMSNPIKNQVKIIFPTEINTSIHKFGVEEKQTLKFENTPVLRMSLFHSLASFENAVLAGDNRFGSYIKEVFYENSKFQVVDNTNEDQLYLSGDLLSFWIVNKEEDNKFSSGVIFTAPNIVYNPEYKFKNQLEQIRYQRQLDLGGMSLDLNLMISDYNHDIDTDTKERRKSSNINYNAKKIEVNGFKMHTNKFGMFVNGIYDKTPADHFPVFDFNLRIKGYKDLVQYYAAEINSAIDASGPNQPIFPIGKITEEQANTFASILERLSLEGVKENEVLLKVIRNKEKSEISGKPMLVILKQLQALFLANLPATHSSMPLPNNHQLMIPNP